MLKIVVVNWLSGHDKWELLLKQQQQQLAEPRQKLEVYNWGFSDLIIHIDRERDSLKKSRRILKNKRSSLSSGSGVVNAGIFQVGYACYREIHC